MNDATITRPYVHQLLADNIPLELRPLNQWVLWRLVLINGKWNKIPYRPTGIAASTTNPAHWSPLGVVLSSYKGGGFDGIGFVVTAAAAIVGVDLDKIEQHKDQPEIAAIYRALRKSGTYIEESPSGTGLRAFLYAALPFDGGNNRKLGVELYQAGRYLTVTGHAIAGTGEGVAECQHAVDEMVAIAFPTAWVDLIPVVAATASSVPHAITDDELVQRASKAAYGRSFALLRSGNWRKYYQSTGKNEKSQSEADLAFCLMLASGSGNNAVQMDRMFRSSGLMRAKWDRRSGITTYGETTIRKAISLCTNVEPMHAAGDTLEDTLTIGDQYTFSEQEAIAWMNARYFVATRGDKVRICEWDAKFGLREYGQEDLKLKLKNRRVRTSGGDGAPDKFAALATFWLAHPQRRDVQHVGYYPPPAPVPTGAFNLWRGFGVEPTTGLQFEGWNLLAAHIRDVVCNGVEDDAAYLLNFMAHCVQYPDRVGGVAVVLQGAEGTGKGILARTMQKLLGAHGLHLTSRKGLTGQFNDRLETASFIFADETCWAGDHEANDILKALITEPTADLEKKFGARWNAANRLHIIIATNKEWAINAGSDARRFFVLRVGKTHMQDRTHFGAIVRQLENGGYGRLLHDLLHYDLSAFDIGQFPHTAALAEQKGQSLDPVPRWLVGRAHVGTLPNDAGEWGWTSVDALYQDFCKRSGRSIGGATNEPAFGRILRRYMPEGWPKPIRPRVGNRQVRGYEFPDLETLRAHLIHSLGLPADYFSELMMPVADTSPGAPEHSGRGRAAKASAIGST